ncbi:hypothetical protein M5D96_010288 [Drosophila gunungcola]|uniref:Uncharacterized protein n=1 Tax=Drosophila gunungcola TaxID=103775 RepID=A0A9P9YHE1_9MUSC|nr:hypothetical protein M5D96_010288 [Drosophila gunungcola]
MRLSRVCSNNTSSFRWLTFRSVLFSYMFGYQRQSAKEMLSKLPGTRCSSAANVTHVDCHSLRPDDKAKTGASGFRLFITPQYTISDVTIVRR